MDAGCLVGVEGVRAIVAVITNTISVAVRLAAIANGRAAILVVSDAVAIAIMGLMIGGDDARFEDAWTGVYGDVAILLGDALSIGIPVIDVLLGE